MRFAFRVLKMLVQKTREFLWDALCLTYVFIWGIKSPLRQFLNASAAIVLLTSSLMFMVEMVTLFHDQMTVIPPLRWVKVTIVLFAIWLVYHRLKEMRHQQRANVFTTRIVDLFEEMAAMNLGMPNDRQSEEFKSCIKKILIAFKDVFDGKTKARVKLNLMMPTQNILKIEYLHPEHNDYEPNFELEKGQGCAGKAFSDMCAVYVPAIRFEYGVLLSKIVEEEHNGVKVYPLRKFNDLAGKVYVRTRKHPYKSIISVPIRTAKDPKKVIGVLNVDSVKQNAFGMLDQDVAHVAASALAMVLCRDGSAHVGNGDLLVPDVAAVENPLKKLDKSPVVH